MMTGIYIVFGIGGLLAVGGTIGLFCEPTSDIPPVIFLVGLILLLLTFGFVAL